MKQIHDDLDAVVCDAYGWPHDLTDEEILRRLVDLNQKRAEEEAQGTIRWLRPEFQAPETVKTGTQTHLPITVDEEPKPRKPAKAKVRPTKQPWPKTLPAQVKAVRAALAAQPAAVTPAQLAKSFQRGRTDRVAVLLDTLVSLGQARALDNGRYVAA